MYPIFSYFGVSVSQRSHLEGEKSYAVKSADAVAALDASGLNLACHTAPLWPMKVPILNIGQYI